MDSIVAGGYIKVLAPVLEDERVKPESILDNVYTTFPQNAFLQAIYNGYSDIIQQLVKYEKISNYLDELIQVIYSKLKWYEFLQAILS